MDDAGGWGSSLRLRKLCPISGGDGGEYTRGRKQPDHESCRGVGRWRELFPNALVLVGWIQGQPGTPSRQRWGTGDVGIAGPRGPVGEMA